MFTLTWFEHRSSFYFFTLIMDMASNNFLSRTVIQSINVLQTRRPPTHLGVRQNLQPWKPKFLDVFDVYICLRVDLDLDHHIFKYPSLVPAVWLCLFGIWTSSIQFSDSQWWAMPTCLSSDFERTCLEAYRNLSGYPTIVFWHYATSTSYIFVNELEKLSGINMFNSCKREGQTTHEALHKF